MNGFYAPFATLDVGGRLLVLMAAASIVLAIIAIALAITTLVLRQRHLRTALRWKGLEARWESELLDMLSGDRAADVLTDRVSPSDALYFVDYLSRFARRLRGSERAIIVDVAAPYLPRMARQMHAPRAVVRARAVRTLSLLGIHEYAPAIIAALDDRSPLVAMTAARELTRREQPDFANAVLERLSQFRHWSPEFLATMLAAIGPDAASPLRTMFGNARELLEVRVVAADALRMLNDIPSADIAADLASGRNDRDLVAASLRLLKACGSPRHAPCVRALAGHVDDVVRMHACAALGTLGDAEDVPMLVAALDDRSTWVAWRAANALRVAGGRTALERFAATAHPRADLAREALAESA